MLPSAQAGSTLLAGRSPELIDEETGAAVWLLDAPGILIRLGQVTHITVQIARFIVERTTPIALDLSGGKPFAAICDWTAMTGYDSQARSILTQWILQHRSIYLRLTVIWPPSNAIARMGIQVGATMLSVAGVKLEIADSLDEVMRRYKYHLLAPGTRRITVE